MGKMKRIPLKNRWEKIKNNEPCDIECVVARRKRLMDTRMKDYFEDYDDVLADMEKLIPGATDMTYKDVVKLIVEDRENQEDSLFWVEATFYLSVPYVNYYRFRSRRER